MGKSGFRSNELTEAKVRSFSQRVLVRGGRTGGFDRHQSIVSEAVAPNAQNQWNGSSEWV